MSLRQAWLAELAGRKEPALRAKAACADSVWPAWQGLFTDFCRYWCGRVRDPGTELPSWALCLADLKAGGSKQLSFAESTVKASLNPAESTRLTKAFLPTLPFHWPVRQQG